MKPHSANRLRALALSASFLGAFTVSASLAGCDAVDPAGPFTASPSPLDARTGDGFTTSHTDLTTGETTRGWVERVPLCHYDADAGTYRRIEVGAPALGAHLGHGDGAPGGEAPGGTFDDACGIVPAQPFTCEARTGVDVLGRNTLTITNVIVDPAYYPVTSFGFGQSNVAQVDVSFIYDMFVIVGVRATFHQTDPSTSSSGTLDIAGPNTGGPYTCGPYTFGAP